MFDLNELIVKPVPRKLDESGVVVTIKNTDMTEKAMINRVDMLERLRKMKLGESVEPLSEATDKSDISVSEATDKSVSEATTDNEDKSDNTENHLSEDKESVSESKSVSEAISDNEARLLSEAKTKTKNKDKNEEEYIQKDIEDKDVTFSDEPTTKSHPKQKLVHKISPYYIEMHREFVEKMKTLFDEDKEAAAVTTCDNIETQAQQKVVASYLNLKTPYRGLLLYHGMGSGKTCTAVAVAEGMKSEKHIVVMTPKSLETNFYKDLKKCAYRKKNQYWLKMKPKDKKEEEETLKITHGLWVGKSNEDKGAHKYDDLTVDEQEEVNNQIDLIIKDKYSSILYDNLDEKTMSKITENDSKNPFDNCVVIMDEAHNFATMILQDKSTKDKSTKDEPSPCMRLYEFLMGAKNCRLVFLTATPIVECVSEIGILYNMLHGYIKTWTIQFKGKKDSAKRAFAKNKYDHIDIQDNKIRITRNPYGFDKENLLEDEDKFLKQILADLKENGVDVENDPKVSKQKCLPDEDKTFRQKFLDNTDSLKRRIVGLTSYFKGAPEELLPRFDKNRDLKVVRVPMSEYQQSVYLKKEDKKDDKKEDQDKREACTFVYPEKYKEGDPIHVNKEALQTFSPKLAQMLENIEDNHDDSLHLVYSETSCEIIREIFKQNGYDEFLLKKTGGEMWDLLEKEYGVKDEKEDENGEKETKKQKPKFVFFSDIKDTTEKKILRNIYNSNWSEVTSNIRDKLEKMAKNNHHGKIIKVFLINADDAEGISLKNTRYVHLVQPCRNNSRVDQVIGRARRLCSHRDLPTEEQTVKAFMYMSTTLNNETKSIDEIVFENANKKDNDIQKILTVLKETAIDCGIYKDNEDIVCYNFVEDNNKQTVMVGGKLYKIDKDKNLYDGTTPFGKLSKDGDTWSIK